MTKSWIISIIAVSFFALSTNHIHAQSSISDFGIKQYGNSFEQPFHSSTNLRQDSNGRLQFDHGSKTYSFDGKDFEVDEQISRGHFWLEDVQGGHWYENAQKQLIRYDFGDTLLIELRDYFETGMTYFYEIGDTLKIVSHFGIANVYANRDHAAVEVVQTFDWDAYEMYQKEDTTFIRTLNQSLFITNNDFTKPQRFGTSNSSDLHNGVFYLPGSRCILHLTDGDTLLDLSSPYTEFILDFEETRIKSVTLDKEGKLWLISSEDNKKGVFILNPKTMAVVNLYLDDDILSNTRQIFEDENGGIWLGTSGSGLVQIYEKSVFVLNKAIGLGEDNVWSTCKGEHGEVYLAIRCNGIASMRSGHEIKSFKTDGCAWSLLSEGNSIWIGDSGIKLIENGRTIKHISKSDGILSRRVFSLFRDGNGMIWIGTRTAIHKFDGERVEQFVIPDVDIYDGVFNIEEVESGKLIIALQSGRMFIFENEVFDEITFTDKLVTRILKDQDNNLLVSTIGAGLYLFEANQFKKIKDAPNTILQMQDDDQGTLWGITSDNRMFYANKDSLMNGKGRTQVNYLTPSHGLPLISQNYDAQPTTTLLDDGRVLFPNIHGAILIDPKGIQKPFPLFNFMVKNGGKSGLRHDLDYGENDIRIRLQGINLHPERPIEYQYKYKDSWKNIDDETNEFTLNNLPNGKHVLRVRGRFKNQNWFPSKSIVVTVQPLVYEKTWVQLLALIFLAGAMVAVIKWRTGIVKRQNEYLSRKVKEQTKEIENEKQQLAQSLDQQQQLTKELSLSQKAKNRLYAQIAHEFKSPLQAMNTYLSKSHVSLTSSDQNRIAKNIKNLLNTSNEILELSKAESGELVAKKNYYNINSIIFDQIELMQSLIMDKNIKVLFLQKDVKTYLYIDISLFQKVIGNLLSNAIKFSPVNATVHVTSENQDGMHYVAVKDQGPGIPKDEVANVLLPYFQATNNVVGGTGIGLSFVESILKLHDSRLHIDTAIGVGSTFYFFVQYPEIDQSEIVNRFVHRHDVNNQLARQFNKNKPLILVVDDNEGVLHFYLSTLSPQYNVITALNGENALSALAQVKPDIVISDVNMPIMGGVELLKEVRKKSNLKAVPFFFVTGSTSDEMEIRSMKSGVDIVLKKPIQEDYLRSRIERVLNLKSDLEDLVKSDFTHNMLPQDIQDDDLMLVKQMEEVILKNIDNNKLKSADIAAMLGIGERTLRNRIKSISGLTIKEYLKNYRLEKAKILIEQSERTKAEIAVAVGFSSLSYFSKSYRSYFEDKRKITSQ